MLILVATFLLLSASSSGALSALIGLGRYEGLSKLKSVEGPFFFQKIAKRLLAENPWQGILLSLNVAKHLFLLLYSIFAYQYLASLEILAPEWYWLIGAVAAILGASLIVEFLLVLWSRSQLSRYLLLLGPFLSLVCLIASPLAALFLKVASRFLGKEEAHTIETLKERMNQFLQESDLGKILEPADKKLLLSIASFKESTAREVMVPRIDMFSLSAESSVREAMQSLIKEGYSRIPVYKESVDHIIGVLHYKDLLRCFSKKFDEKVLDSPIEEYVKPALYTPETKKISPLLQEFRLKQSHLAIVVDEYGGTEGIVTIEDILEELVGEIADEYDVGEESPFSAVSSGGWIVDAKLSIRDVEEELGIHIPSSPEYDTLGGYIFHRAGAIPTKGFRLHDEEFDLEVLSSDERSIDKVKILKNTRN